MNPPASLCPLCGRKSLSAFKNKKAYQWDSRSCMLDECASCGLVFQNPVPDDLSSFYEGYRGEAGKRFLNRVEAIIRFFRRRRARTVNGFFPRPGRVLDIGCGRGQMLRELGAMGWECFGTEFPGQASRDLPFTVYEGDIADLNLPAQSFDAVTLWHVFEHLSDPFSALTEICRILKPGGLLVISVPNIESLQAKIFGRNWIHLDLPRHIYHFSPGSLSRAMEGKGFTITGWRHFSAEYGMSGVILSLGAAMMGKGPGFFNTLRGGQKKWRAYGTFAYSVCMAPLAAAFSTMEALLKRGGEVMVLARKSGETLE